MIINLILLLILVISCTQTSEKNSLQSLNNIGYSPKYWLSYVKKLLFSGIENTCQFTQTISSYIAKRRECIGYNVKRTHSVMRTYDQPLRKSCQGICNLTRPIGYSFAVGKGYQIVSNKRIHWIFDMDKKLRIKIFLHYIYFSLQNLHNCYIGYLSVNSLSKQEANLSYCGIHSGLVIYPQYNDIELLLFAGQFITFVVIFFYRVTDPMQKISISINNDFIANILHTDLNLEWMLKSIQSNTFQAKFKVNVQKWKFIILSICKNIIPLFNACDGPGILSPKLKPEKPFQKVCTSHPPSSVFSLLMNLI